MRLICGRDLNEEEIADITSAAFDGGIGYWCSSVKVEDYKGQDFASEVPAYGGIVILTEDEDGTEHELTLEKLHKGIQMAIDAGMWDGDDVCDVDSDVADNIIQFAIFGELVYG